MIKDDQSKKSKGFSIFTWHMFIFVMIVAGAMLYGKYYGYQKGAVFI